MSEVTDSSAWVGGPAGSTNGRGGEGIAWFDPYDMLAGGPVPLVFDNGLAVLAVVYHRVPPTHIPESRIGFRVIADRRETVSRAHGIRWKTVSGTPFSPEGLRNLWPLQNVTLYDIDDPYNAKFLPPGFVSH